MIYLPRLFAVLTFFITPFAMAGTIPLQVLLDEIQVLKVAEQHGDEVYFNITGFYSGGESFHTTMPPEPTHWLTRHLESVKDVRLWNGRLHESSSLELVFELTERDAPPWNLDDLIGVAKIKLHNDAGALHIAWSQADNPMMTESVVVRPKDSRVYNFTNDHGSYRVKFTIHSGILELP